MPSTPPVRRSRSGTAASKRPTWPQVASLSACQKDVLPIMTTRAPRGRPVPSLSAATSYCSPGTIGISEQPPLTQQLSGRLTREAALKRWKPLIAWPVHCGAWILIMASSQRVHWSYQQPATPLLGDHDEV